MKFKRGWKGRYRGYAKVPLKGQTKNKHTHGKVCRKKKKKGRKTAKQEQKRRTETREEKTGVGGRREQRARIAFAPVSTGAP